MMSDMRRTIAVRSLRIATTVVAVAAVAASLPMLFPGQAAYVVQRAIVAKMVLSGLGPDCSFTAALDSLQISTSFNRAVTNAASKVRVVRIDSQHGIALYDVGAGRTLWARASTDSTEWLLGYLLVDHNQLRQNTSYVRPGDVVIDCGAHIGVMSQAALEAGASRVIAVEPDPLNRECLRRNLAPYSAAGRVTFVDKGVWSSETSLTLQMSEGNSGGHSAAVPVHDSNGHEETIAVTTIDRIVQTLNVPRVDFIKMDIEGAEREALKGAMGTLRRFRPRLMLDSYHRPDDMQAFRSIIQGVEPRYAYSCAFCEIAHGMLVPHVTFWRAD